MAAPLTTLSGEAILMAENSEKAFGGRSFAQNPAGELTALPTPDRLAGGKGVAAPPQNITPRARPSAL